jgi:hypothetical protein
MPGVSRARALGAITVFGVAGPLAVAAGSAAGAKIDPADVTILNTLLQSANAGVHLYNAAVTAKILSAPVSVATNQFAADHAAHRDVLIAVITAGGGEPIPEGPTSQVDPSTTEAAFLAGALTFERQTVGNYLNAVPALKNRELTKTVASILGVIAAHVALLAEALRENPAFPTSFVT